MGDLYRIYCETCGATSNITYEGFSGAVVFDSETPGDIVAGGYLAYLRGPDDLVILPHPLERSSLEEAGGSWTSASLNGRLLHLTNLICTQCGAINRTATVHSAGLGCFTGLIVGGLILAFNLLFLRAHWLVEFWLVWLGMSVPALVGHHYVRFRHADKASPYVFSKCVQCGSREAVALHAAMERKLPCAKCNAQSVTISHAGVS